MMLARKTPGPRLRLLGVGLVSAIAIGAAVASWAQNTPSPAGAPLIAPANPLTMTDEQAHKTLERLLQPDGGPPDVAPADLDMLRAQLETRLKSVPQLPAAPATPILDRAAMLKAVQAQTAPARIANATFACDVWTGKYSNIDDRTFDWKDFNNEAAVLLSINTDSFPTVTIPANAFPSGVFPAHGKIAADNRFIDTSSISYRLMSNTLIDSLTFMNLDQQIAQVRWERIKLGDPSDPRETFLNGFCRRTSSPPRQDGGTADAHP